MISEVDTYLSDGCGRCSYYKTPKCKVLSWSEELIQLRRIVLECGLSEYFKWSQPCYTYEGKNILLVTAFKNYAALAFFKGSLLKDTHHLLEKPGKSSQATQQLRYTSASLILKQEDVIKAYIYEAIEVEKKGLKVKFKKNMDAIPDELRKRLDEDIVFKAAFKGLTPGRQRGYILYFSQPKQSKTRIARIDKYVHKILDGEGLNDHYKSKQK